MVGTGDLRQAAPEEPGARYDDSLSGLEQVRDARVEAGGPGPRDQVRGIGRVEQAAEEVNRLVVDVGPDVAVVRDDLAPEDVEIFLV